MTEFLPQIRTLGHREEAHLYRAEALYIQGEYEQAIAECKLTLEKHAKTGRAELMLGYIYVTLGNYSAAREACVDAIAADPESENAYILLGKIYSDNEEYDDAISAFQSALQINPNNSDVNYLLGVIYFEQGEWELSKNVLESALRINPQMDNALYRLSNVYLAMGDEESALREVEKALRIRPTFKSHELLGDLHFSRGDLRAALSEYLEGVRILPEYDTLHQKAGKVLIQLGQTQLAIIELKRALEINSNPAKTHFLLGQAYTEIEDWEQASREYNAALEIDSENSDAKNGLDEIELRIKSN